MTAPYTKWSLRPKAGPLWLVRRGPQRSCPPRDVATCLVRPIAPAHRPRPRRAGTHGGRACASERSCRAPSNGALLPTAPRRAHAARSGGGGRRHSRDVRAEAGTGRTCPVRRAERRAVHVDLPHRREPLAQRDPLPEERAAREPAAAERLTRAWKGRLPRSGVPDVGGAADRRGQASPALQRARAEAIDSLSETLRTTLILVCVDGRSHEEAAEILGAPEGTIAWRVHESRRKLRELLAARGFDLEDALTDGGGRH